MTSLIYLAPPNNSLALASSVLGWVAWAVAFLLGLAGWAESYFGFALALIVAGIPGLLAIIFGFIGVSTANRLGGKRRGLAIQGVVLGFTPAVAVFVGAIVGGIAFGR